MPRPRNNSGGSLGGAIIGSAVLLSPGRSNAGALLEGLNAALGRHLLIEIAVAVVWVAWCLWRRLRTSSTRDLEKVGKGASPLA